MKVHSEDIQEKLNFIDRTIYHAVRACRSDDNIPSELKHCVDALGQESSQVQQAVRTRDARSIRQCVDRLARLSERAQNALHPSDGMNYELKSAVILTHIELSALRHQLG